MRENPASLTAEEKYWPNLFISPILIFTGTITSFLSLAPPPLISISSLWPHNFFFVLIFLPFFFLILCFSYFSFFYLSSFSHPAVHFSSSPPLFVSFSILSFSPLTSLPALPLPVPPTSLPCHPTPLLFLSLPPLLHFSFILFLLLFSWASSNSSSFLPFQLFPLVPFTTFPSLHIFLFPTFSVPSPPFLSPAVASLISLFPIIPLPFPFTTSPPHYPLFYSSFIFFCVHLSFFLPLLLQFFFLLLLFISLLLTLLFSYLSSSSFSSYFLPLFLSFLILLFLFFFLLLLVFLLLHFHY